MAIVTASLKLLRLLQSLSGEGLSSDVVIGFEPHFRLMQPVSGLTGRVLLFRLNAKTGNLTRLCWFFERSTGIHVELPNGRIYAINERDSLESFGMRLAERIRKRTKISGRVIASWGGMDVTENYSDYKVALLVRRTIAKSLLEAEQTSEPPGLSPSELVSRLKPNADELETFEDRIFRFVVGGAFVSVRLSVDGTWCPLAHPALYKGSNHQSRMMVLEKFVQAIDCTAFAPEGSRLC